MTLDDIPADEILVLTEQLARLFRAKDCEPTCHCCYEPIKVGETFKLAMVDAPVSALSGRDVMLCDKHSVADLIARREKDRKERVRLGLGFSRPHKCTEGKRDIEI